MLDPERFPFSITSEGNTTARPLLPLTLIYRGKSVEVAGLLDSGADVNVLPYQLGNQLGAAWEAAQPVIRLSGNLARVEARAIIVDARVGRLPPARLAFAWTRDDAVPLLLGQMNFFAEFDVCFFRSRGYFEIRKASS